MSESYLSRKGRVFPVCDMIDIAIATSCTVDPDLAQKRMTGNNGSFVKFEFFEFSRVHVRDPASERGCFDE